MEKFKSFVKFNNKTEEELCKPGKKFLPCRKTKKNEVCEDCKMLMEYALFRLEKCPFKVNKTFCSFCKIHCYTPLMRNQIKEVMKYSGPRMLWTHPLFAMKHVFQMIRYKRKLKKEKKGKENV